MTPVRYSNAPGAEIEANVEAPVSVVWAVVTDIELPARFSSELQRVERLDGMTETVAGLKALAEAHPS